MKNLVRILLCLCLSTFAIGRAISHAASPSPAHPAKAEAHKKPGGKKATAKELVATSKKALASMLKKSRADKELDPKKPKNKPFYLAAKKIAAQLDRAEKGLGAKNNDFFDATAKARTAHEQMVVAWDLTGSKNKQVAADGKALGHALDALRKDYSKEAARKKKGGELTAKEKEQFEKIKAQQKDLIAKIDKLEAKAKKDKALEQGLAKMKKEAQHIASAPLTVNDYIAALYLIDTLEGQLYGYDYYVDPAWRGDWIVVDTFLSLWAPIYTDFWYGVDYDWAYFDNPVDVYVDDYDVYDSVPAEDVAAEEEFVENEPDMTEAEENDVADDNDVDTDSGGDEEMGDDADDSGADESADDDSGDNGGDESADDDSGGGDDDGGDDGGGDDGGE